MNSTHDARSDTFIPLPQPHYYAPNNIHVLSSETRQSQSVLSKHSLPVDESSHHPYPLGSERVACLLTARPPSPDILSRVSTSCSLTGPQLRKKPRITSIASTCANTPSSHEPTHPSSSTIALVDNQPHPTTTSTGHNFANSGKPLLRANSGSLQQSLANKRPPASHSSYGVETTCGPPPSYSTQRTLSTERIKKVDRNAASRMLLTQSIAPTVSIYNTAEDIANTVASRELTLLVPPDQPSPDTDDPQSIPTPTDEVPMSHFNIGGEHDTNRPSTMDDSKGSSSDERKSEDLFLNIAKVDAARSSTSKPSRRRSRISLPFVSSTRSINESSSSPVLARFERTESPQTEVTRYLNKRSSIGQHISGAFSGNYTQDSSRVREQSAGLPSNGEQYDTPSGRRTSNTNTESVRMSQRSSQALRNTRLTSESLHTTKPTTDEHIATDSTISTTAPSTVWDELDDLKSRIRKLELTGKLPSSSAAAMSSTERPRTATTAATTMSASPRYKPATTALPSPMEGISPNIHPLLHEALGNAEQVLSNEVFQKLYATAQDALQLAAMMSMEASGNAKNVTDPGNERQIKRRTESMCRGLTELTIALAADSRPAASNMRPISRDSSHPPSTMFRSRRYSNDHGDRSLPSRVQSRLDNRQMSVHLGQAQHEAASPDASARNPITVLPQLPGLRLNHSSTAARNRRVPSHVDGNVEDTEESPSFRAASRAMTDLGVYRRSSRDYVATPREYTSQYPLPNRANAILHSSTPLPVGVSTNFTSRRKYASPASIMGVQESSSPITPRDASSGQDAWGGRALVPGHHASPDAITEAIVNSTGRSGSSRRSLGLASRIGSSVGSRLRAVRAERSARESIDTRSMKGIAPSFMSDHDDDGIAHHREGQAA